MLVGLAIAAAAAPAATTAVSASQVVARFKAASGATLLVDTRSSYSGHYTALSLSPSIANQAKYGRFTLFVVGPATLAEDVRKLLADGHTGVLGAPGLSNIYWESGRYLSGGTYWLAKKQYGTNLVLWWYGAQKRVDKAFSRLHLPLSTRVVGP